jgi:hypothetical protein
LIRQSHGNPKQRSFNSRLLHISIERHAVQIRGRNQGNRLSNQYDHPDFDPVRAHTFHIFDNLPAAEHADIDFDIRHSRRSLHVQHQEQNKAVEEEMVQITSNSPWILILL